MLERFCYWHLEDKEKLYCSENCKNLEVSFCPYRLEDIKRTKNNFLIEGCKEFIPLDNVRDYFKNNQKTNEE